MKDICICLVVVVMLAFAVRYAYQIRKKNISPALSTWIILLVGTGLSLATYAVAQKHDFRSGIMNTIDVIYVSIILGALLRWGEGRKRFASFEKWYLRVAGAVFAYWVIFGDAKGSNYSMQVLISVGYFPTMQKLFLEKRNTESFTGWICVLAASLIAIYPARENGNAPSVVYALRSAFFAAIIIGMMIYYEFVRGRRS